MIPRDTRSKGARATSTELDLEHGAARPNYDAITTSGSSSRTPDNETSRTSTPKLRGSMQLEDNAAPGQPSQNTAHRVRTRIEASLPKPVIHSWGKVSNWIKGPQPPQRHQITPLFERWQTKPNHALARLPRCVRMFVLVIACILWVVIFAVVISDYSLPSNIGGLGAPVRLSCVANLWSSPQACGIDGRNCLPFSNSSFAFNCPANCLSAQVLNPRSIGAQIINYRSLVVGGTPESTSDGSEQLVYRGDSFICGAAIHAGVISNSNGGCGVVSLIGEAPNYGSATRNGIASLPFDTSFPMSFTFNRAPGVTNSTCRDPRWNLLILSTIFTALFGIFTTSPTPFFFPIFTILFFQVAMASDPPSYTTYASLASIALGRFLPAIFVATLFYLYAIHKTLLHCRASIEKTILWVGAAWVGALGNYTFDQIPIQRLTGHDIRQQPGAIVALVIIVLVIFAIALYQIWCFQREARLARYLALYATIGVGLGVLAAFQGLNLRIHHYILALLLLPGTAMQTRLSLLCQGLLVGLFVNGVARWGFDSILQTSAALRGDAQLGSGVPRILEPVVNGSSITFVWESLLRGYEGVSVLVNDVERYRGFDAGSSGASGSGGGGGGGIGGNQSSFTWTRQASDEPEYFRFGFINYQPFGGVSYSDFTRAGTWWPNGTWGGIPAGRTGY